MNPMKQEIVDTIVSHINNNYRFKTKAAEVLGLSRSNLCLIMTGKRTNIKFETLFDICDKLDIPYSVKVGN